MLATESTIERNAIVRQNTIAERSLSPSACPLEVTSGICVATVVTAAPFLAFYALSQAIGLTSAHYPAIANAAAVLGATTSFLSLPLVHYLKKRSGASLVLTSSVIFSLLGLIASLSI